AFHLEIGMMAHNDYHMPSQRRLQIDHARQSKIFYRQPTTDDKQRDLERACDQHDQIDDAIQRREPDEAAEIGRAQSEWARRRRAE
ncbi:FCD domain-containing protein, partial [Pseudomonas aeruginosa]